MASLWINLKMSDGGKKLVFSSRWQHFLSAALIYSTHIQHIYFHTNRRVNVAKDNPGSTLLIFLLDQKNQTHLVGSFGLSRRQFIVQLLESDPPHLHLFLHLLPESMPLLDTRTHACTHKHTHWISSSARIQNALTSGQIHQPTERVPGVHVYLQTDVFQVFHFVLQAVQSEV